MSGPHRQLYLFSLLARLIGFLLQYWGLALVAAFLLSPVGPHLLIESYYRTVYGQRTYVSCSYLGSRGFVTPRYVEGCPLIAWLDSREGRQ